MGRNSWEPEQERKHTHATRANDRAQVNTQLTVLAVAHKSGSGLDQLLVLAQLLRPPLAPVNAENV